MPRLLPCLADPLRGMVSNQRPGVLQIGEDESLGELPVHRAQALPRFRQLGRVRIALAVPKAHQAATHRHYSLLTGVDS